MVIRRNKYSTYFYSYEFIFAKRSRHSAQRIYTLIISLGLSLGCIGMFFLTKNLFILFLIIVSLRFFGQGAMTHTSTTTMSRYDSDDRGKAISVGEFGGMFGFITFPLIDQVLERSLLAR